MNTAKKIYKCFILFLVNTCFRGTHFFSIKRLLLNTCKGVTVAEGARIVTPIKVSLISNLDVGKNTWVGRAFSLEGNGEVKIGDNCDLAPCVTALTGSHNVGSSERRAGSGYNGNIVINNGSWIGSHSIILPNVVIGHGCVIGAGSVVTKNTDNNKLYAGNPIREIRKYEED